MHRIARKAVLIAGVMLMASATARAQTDAPLGDPLGDLLTTVQTGVDQTAPADQQSASHPLTATDAGLFRQAVESARRADVNGARNAIASMTDSLARKTATWVLVDVAGDSLGFYEVDKARRDLADWPRASRRQASAERQLETSGKAPKDIVAWFDGDQPTTAQGAMALASAYRSLGEPQAAAKLIRHWWRDKSFDADAQRAMLTRFADVLSQEDHARRADVLLYGPIGPAVRDITALLPADQQAAAQARIALRGDARDSNELWGALPADVANSSGVAFERAAYLRRKGLDSLAMGQVENFPHEVATTEQAQRIWDERHRLVLSALRNGDARGAYAAAANSGLTEGSEGADAEFTAGWIALTRLNEPAKAAKHFAVVEKIATTSITRGRALYWLGRSAEARHDREAAEGFYGRAARYNTTFYGMLGAERLGQPLALPSDPTISPEMRARFEGREPIQATRLFWDNGLRDLYRVMVANLDDSLPTVQDEAQLVDLTRNYGDQDLSMKVVRTAAQRGFILPNRAYPMRNVADSAAEPALVLAITRQESGFNPTIRSGAGARGMMQLMPSTAAILARKMGVSYSSGRLDDADYNMRLGSTFLGQLVNQFSGSYVMAIAGYNAGPGRPTQWSSFCGDPRGGATDPLDFIECIPFSETRNYVMRVMENVQVYRAKLSGGAVPITLTADLKRGGYSYSSPQQPVVAAAEASAFN